MMQLLSFQQCSSYISELLTTSISPNPAVRQVMNPLTWHYIGRQVGGATLHAMGSSPVSLTLN